MDVKYFSVVILIFLKCHSKKITDYDRIMTRTMDEKWRDWLNRMRLSTRACMRVCDEVVRGETGSVCVCVYRGVGLAPCGCLQVQDVDVVVPTSSRAVPL